MNTITPNAAHEAVLAKPCLLQLVLQVQDDTESLRTVLRAYGAVEMLIAYTSHSHATVTGDNLSALLQTLNDAMDVRLDALCSKLDAVHAALRNRESMPTIAGRRALDALDHTSMLQFVRNAYAAMQNLMPFAENASGDGLSAAIQLLGETMAARLQTMDEKLDALHAALVHEGAAP